MRMALAKPSRVVTWLPGTPCPLANDTQSKNGRSRSSMRLAFSPASGPPMLASSPRKMRYERLAKITTVTSRFSRAMLQSACRVYIALPSPIKANTLRSGQATAAPTAAGKPQPIAPPVMSMQSCGAACGKVLANWRPEVTASSTMMAFSGKVAAMMAPKCSTEGVPVGKSVMMGPVDSCAGAVC